MNLRKETLIKNPEPEMPEEKWVEVTYDSEIRLGEKLPNIFPSIRENDDGSIEREFIQGTNLHSILETSKIPVSVGLQAVMTVVQQLREIYEDGEIVGDRNGYNIILQNLESIDKYVDGEDYPIRQIDVEDDFVNHVDKSNQLSQENWDLLLGSCISLLTNLQNAFDYRNRWDTNKNISYMALFHSVKEKINELIEKLNESPGDGEEIFSDLEIFLQSLSSKIEKET